MNRKPQFDLFGEDPPADLDFFADANPSIGEIIYGYSSCKLSDAPPSGLKRFFTGMIGVIVGIILGFVILRFSESIDAIWEIILYIVLGGLGYFFSKAEFRKSIGYVGTEGIEWIDATKTRKNITYRALFLYKNATELQQKLDDKYENGGYNGTHYTYRWFRIYNDKKITTHEIWGYVYFEKEGGVSLKEYPKFLYCKRAEKLWTKYLWQRYVDLVQNEGFVDFYILPEGHFHRNQFIRLSTNYIELHWANRIHHLRGSDMHDLTNRNGELRIRSAGSDISISIYAISNRHLFTRFLEIVQFDCSRGEGTSYESLRKYYYAL